MSNFVLNPRDVAVQALRDRAGNVSAHLDRLLAAGSLSEPDRHLARELALGTIRHRQTLWEILRVFLAQPNRKLPVPLTEIMEVGLYQLLFLDRIPAFAVVNEAVAQANRFHHKRRSGVVNGVLRNIVRALSDVIDGEPPAAVDAVPISPHSYRKLAKSVFPDPATDPATYLARAYSLPIVLAERWFTRSKSLAKAAGLAMHANVRAPMILRVNRLRATTDEAMASLAADGVEASPHVNGRSIVLAHSTNVMRLDAFNRGMVQVQDAAATAVVEAAPVKPGMTVLDFCAAPGGKTTHLAERMENRGAITAVDVSQDKLERIVDNCRRTGVSIVTTHLADEVGSLAPGGFDLALVDAPCSNTGVLSRRAEARWRFDVDSLRRSAVVQRALLGVARNFVRKGGTIVYSTCSIEPEECGDVVRRAEGLKLIREQFITPGGADRPTAWCDGGYYAILEVK